ncbi:MAG: DUF6268 family outer membrane beta-barrel protein [Allomuricauda sp.]
MNYKVFIFSFVSLLFLLEEGFCQLNDLARVDYTIVPAGNSNIEYNRVRALFNYPIKLEKNGTYLFLGLDYSNINLLVANSPLFDRDEIDGFQLLDFNIGYTTPLKNDWRLGVRFSPGLSSNLKANDLNLEDVVLSGDIVFIKDKKDEFGIKNPWRLILGMSYSGNRGINFPLPFVSYYRKFHRNWSFNIGIPKSNLQYHISERHRLKLYTELDGFTSNLQNGLTIIGTAEEASSINSSIILGGLQYEYHIIENLEFYLRSSYIFSNSIWLRDKDNNNILSLDDSNALYFRTGIRYKL